MKQRVYVVLITVVGYVILTAFFVAQTPESHAKASTCQPGISITGNSNLTPFTLHNKLVTVSINPCSQRYDSTALLTKKFWYTIPVKNFKADQPQVYKDFLTLLKADQHPDIQLGILLVDLHRMLAKTAHVSFPLEVQMAGKTKTYHITSRVNGCNQRILVSGQQTIKLTDFDLQPPRKLFGLIRVDNEIMVTFDFLLVVGS